MYDDVQAGPSRLAYPSAWVRAEELPPSPGLVLLTRGRSGSQGCPGPFLLLHRQAEFTGTLEQATALYERIEKSRRPGRETLERRQVTVPGAQEALLLISQFPAEQAGADGDAPPSPAAGQLVRAFDLLVLTETGLAEHLYASGCPQDLPEDFLERAVLSLRSG